VTAILQTTLRRSVVAEAQSVFHQLHQNLLPVQDLVLINLAAALEDHTPDPVLDLVLTDDALVLVIDIAETEEAVMLAVQDRDPDPGVMEESILQEDIADLQCLPENDILETG